MANQLAVYLEKRKKLNELSDLYSSLGRYNEASLVHYRAAATDAKSTEGAQQLHVKAQKVKYVVNSHFGNPSNLDGQHVTEHVNLLERASPVLSSAAEKFSGRVTVFSLLAYCAANHFEVRLVFTCLTFRKLDNSLLRRLQKICSTLHWPSRSAISSLKSSTCGLVWWEEVKGRLGKTARA